MRSVILGLGNPILGDDGIGPRVAQELENHPVIQNLPNLEIAPFYRGGLSLMERLVGYDQAFIIDSFVSSSPVPGRIHRLSVDDLPSLYANSSHDISLKAAMELGRKMGLPLPEEIIIYAVEIESKFVFTEVLSKEIEASIKPLVDHLVIEITKKI